MTIPSDYRDIVQMLAAKTDEGKVHWRRDTFELGVELEDTKFSLWAGNDEHTEVPFVAFALHGSNGATLDSWYVEEGDDHYSLMHRFYTAAKRHAAGVPQKLKSIKELLAKTDTVGKRN